MTEISRLMFGLLALLIVESPAAQTTYPEKPIRMVVGFPPGSQADTVARLLGQKLAEALGKPIVVDNATGAAGNIATERVAKAAPDGYTLGLLAQGPLEPHAHEIFRCGRSVRSLDNMSTFGGARSRPHSVGHCLWHSTDERLSQCQRTRQ